MSNRKYYSRAGVTVNVLYPAPQKFFFKPHRSQSPQPKSTIPLNESSSFKSISRDK